MVLVDVDAWVSIAVAVRPTPANALRIVQRLVALAVALAFLLRRKWAKSDGDNRAVVGVERDVLMADGGLEALAADPLGAYLTAALLCERVLVEKDDTVSIIRVIDRLTYVRDEHRPSTELPAVAFTFTAFLAIKSGKRRGPTPLRIDSIHPRGQRAPGQTTEVFLGADGVNLINEMEIKVNEPGDYVFEVLLEDRAIARIPLEIALLPAPEPLEPSEASR